MHACSSGALCCTATRGSRVQDDGDYTPGDIAIAGLGGRRREPAQAVRGAGWDQRQVRASMMHASVRRECGGAHDHEQQ